MRVSLPESFHIIWKEQINISVTYAFRVSFYINYDFCSNPYEKTNLYSSQFSCVYSMRRLSFYINYDSVHISSIFGELEARGSEARGVGVTTTSSSSNHNLIFLFLTLTTTGNSYWMIGKVCKSMQAATNLFKLAASLSCPRPEYVLLKFVFPHVLKRFLSFSITIVFFC